MLHFVTKEGGLYSRRQRRISVPYDAVAPLFAVADVFIIVIASIIGAGGYQLVIGGLFDVGSFAGLGLTGSVAYGLGARQLGLYDIQILLRPRHEHLRIVLCILFMVFALTATLFLLKVGGQFSRGSVVSFAVVVSCLLLGARSLARHRLRYALLNGAILGRRALLIGTSFEFSSLSPDKTLTQFGIEEARRVLLPFRKNGQSATELEQAALDTAIDAARELDVRELLLCISWDNMSQLQFLRERLRVLPLPVRLVPDRFVRSIWELQSANDRLPLLIEIQRAPLNRFEQLIKRALDLVIATFALVALSPLMLLTALAVKLESRGPVIFRQRRKGFNGHEFQIYKFRSMRVVEDGPVILQATRNDQRVTILGRILRRASIDELPQLFNVLKGEMSIIGPRPHALAHDDQYESLIGHYAFRHHVRPGITGWAQVNGFRGETPRLDQMLKRVELDLWYIDNWSIGLDLQILARTCVEVFRGLNAY